MHNTYTMFNSEKSPYCLRHSHTLPTFDASTSGPRQNIAIRFGTEKLEWCGYPMVKKV